MGSIRHSADAAMARRRSPLRGVAMLVAALLAAPLSGLAAAGAHAASSPGAPVPFTEYAAATSSSVQTNGTVMAADYQYGSLQAEATGRQAVQLIGQGQYVSFILTSAANAVDFHYAIPDSADGAGLTEPLDLYVNGTLTKALSLTSKYSWLYGNYPFTNTPSVGIPNGEVPHDFYNDVRYLFGSALPAGTVVKLQVDTGDNAPWYVINTADFETVAAAAAQPSGYLNVTQAPYNADSTGAADSTTALQNAISAASAAGEGVYIPQGTYTVSQPLNVNNVTIKGAGEWYTVLTGSDVEFSGAQNPASTNVNVSNLSLYGEVNDRDNSTSNYTGFNGGFSNSTISNIWIQNEKSGIYIIGPTTGVTINAVRIQDTTADGINLYAADGPITNSTVENSFLRNTQDDGIALWSATAGDTSDTVTQNTVDSPGLANNIGIYGSGAGDQITSNLLQDTVQRGGGIEISQNYGSVPMAGTLTISGNELLRTGQWDSGFDYGVGAIWFYPAQGNMNSTINVTSNTIVNSPYEAFMFQNQNAYSGAATTTPPTAGYTVTGVTISNDTVTNVGTFVFQDQAPGSISVSGTTATGVGDAGIFSCGSGFTLTQGSGNSGWSSSTCGMPATSPLWTYPATTTFQNATVGQATAAQQVVVMNTASQAATLGTISASSGFTVSKDPTYPCGSSLDATGVSDNGAWCMVDVSFTAASSGITAGTLKIASNQPGSPAAVQLIGNATGSSGGGGGGTSPTNLALSATMTASSTQSGYPASNTNDSNAATYWESQDSASYPQTLTANLGSSQALGSTTLTLPSSWPARTETFSVRGSTDGSTYTTLASPAGYTFDPSTGNTVTIALPAGTKEQYLQLDVTGNTGWSAAQIAEFEIFSGSGTNLALNKSVTASSVQQSFVAANTVDGNTSTYWESTNGAWPSTLTVDLGSADPLGSVVIDLPTSWPTRTQTLSVLGSTNDTSWTTLASSATYTWNPSTGDTVTISLPSGPTDRYVQLNFTANNVQNGAQVSEVQIIG